MEDWKNRNGIGEDPWERSPKTREPSAVGSDPKAYPGLSLVSGTPGLTGPVPFCWGLVLTAVAITLVFAALGAMAGLGLEAPPRSFGRADVAIDMRI